MQRRPYESANDVFDDVGTDILQLGEREQANSSRMESLIEDQIKLRNEGGEIKETMPELVRRLEHFRALLRTAKKKRRRIYAATRNRVWWLRFRRGCRELPGMIASWFGMGREER